VYAAVNYHFELKGCFLKSAVVHLICGPVGSGKTTYSRDLASVHTAVVFSMDEWMQNLFGGDLPKESDMAKVDYAWFAERVDRCEVQIWSVAEQLLKDGRNVILDLGFIRKARRDKARGAASGHGFQCQLHIVDADIETRRTRVADRNSSLGHTYAFAVTPAMFAFAEKMYEAPDGVESEHATIFRS
jgi:predicted kinase